jgi:hypothetical protein
MVGETGGAGRGAGKAGPRKKGKPGRPKIGLGVVAVSVSLEKGLLARVDAMARELGMPRSALITRGLHAELAAYRKK